MYKNSGYGMPSMPGGWGTGRQILYPEDYGGGEGLQGKIEGADHLP